MSEAGDQGLSDAEASACDADGHPVRCGICKEKFGDENTEF